MRHPWLNLRILLVGSIFLALYAPVFWIAHRLHIPLVYVAVAVAVLLIGEYWLGKRRALASVTTEPWPDTDGFNELRQRVESHSETLGVTPPTLHVAQMGSPNAFAVGRRGHGHVVVSEQLIYLLTPEELEAVLVHELSHLHSRDTVPTLLGDGAARVFTLVLTPVLFIFTSLLADLFASNRREEYRTRRGLELAIEHLIETGVCYCTFAISRQREYIADADSQVVLGTGEPLRRALRKIQRIHETANPASPPTEVETLCLSSDWSLRGLGNTHPPLSERIERLSELDTDD